MAGVKRSPLPIPWQRPWARKIRQYCVLMEVRNTPATNRMLPIRTVGFKYPASVARPEKVPMAYVNQVAIEPIQATSDGGRLRAST